MDRIRKLLILIVLVLAGTASWEEYVLASPSPSVSTVITPGTNGPCTWFVSLDGTTPVARAMANGLSVNVGDNVVGTAGQDLGSFINANDAASQEWCLSAQGYTVSTAININKNSLIIEGSGVGTLLQAGSNNDVFLVTGPVSQASIRDLRIADSVASPKQTSTGGIRLDSSGGQINTLLVSDVYMFGVYNGVYMNTLQSHIANGLETCTFREVWVNNFRNLGWQLYSTFDTVFSNIFAGQNSVSSIHGFVLANSVTSGSTIDNLIVLGSGSTNLGIGVLFQNVTDIYAGRIHADEFKEGLQTGQTVDVTVSQLWLTGSTDNGGLLAHTTGTLHVNFLGVIKSTNAPINNQGNGGNIRVYSGNFTGNGIATPTVRSGDWYTNVAGYNPQPVSSNTAGASPFTTAVVAYPQQAQLTTVNGQTGWTCKGVAMSNSALAYSPILDPGQTCTLTWVTTAPVYELYPL